MLDEGERGRQSEHVVCCDGSEPHSIGWRKRVRSGGAAMTSRWTGNGQIERSVGAFALAVVLAACGNSTMGTPQDSGVVTGDVIRPPNSRYCPLFNETDGGVLRIDGQGNRTTAAMAWPVLCHPNMRAGDPCRATGNTLGTCRDFEYESSGRFPEFTRNNRMALYCRPELEDPCEGSNQLSPVCEAFGNCAAVPDPLPGRPRFVCFPPVCNP